MFKDVMCSAVIVAAGVGKRMGSDRPKQFLSLNGKTIIENHPQGKMKTEYKGENNGKYTNLSLIHI